MAQYPFSTLSLADVPIVDPVQEDTVITVTESGTVRRSRVDKFTESLTGPLGELVEEAEAAAAAAGNKMPAMTFQQLKDLNIDAEFNGVYVEEAGRQGTFVLDNATSLAVDDGLVIQDTFGNKWVRRYSGPIEVKWYGAKGDNSTDDTTAIKNAITAANNGEIFFPQGTYIISSPLPHSCSFLGANSRRTIIKATSGTFTGGFMIDNNNGAERQVMRTLTLDASDKSIQHLGSSGDASGTPTVLYEAVYFTNTAKGTYSIGGSSVGAVAGMLTGATFINCHWRAVGRVANLGQNQDDINFIGCRFALEKCDSTVLDPFVVGVGSNHSFTGCYFYIKDVQSSGAVGRVFRVGGRLTRFQSNFVESTTDLTTLTHLFFLSDPAANLIIDGLHCNLTAGAMVALVRGNVESVSSTYRNVTIRNVSQATNFPTGLYLLDVYVSVATAKTLFLEFDHVDVVDNIVFTAGTANSNPIVKVRGVLKGVGYDTTVSTSGLSTSAEVTRNNSTQTLSNKTLTSPRINNPNTVGFKMGVNPRTASYAVGVNTNTELCDASGGAINATLPLNSSATTVYDGTNAAGIVYVFVKVDSTANVVNVLPQGGELVGGTTGLVLRAQWDLVMIQATGSGWAVLQDLRIGRYVVAPGSNNYTGPATDKQTVELATATADRIYTLPTVSANYSFTLINRNASASFRWLFSASVRLSDGSTTLVVPHNSSMVLRYDGTNWNVLFLSVLGVRRKAVADSNYTVLIDDELVAYITLTTGRTVTLPDPTITAPFKKYSIKDETGNAGTSNITVVSAGTSRNIDGSSSKVINTNYGFINVYSNGSHWFTK